MIFTNLIIQAIIHVQSSRLLLHGLCHASLTVRYHGAKLPQKPHQYRYLSDPLSLCIISNIYCDLLCIIRNCFAMFDHIRRASRTYQKSYRIFFIQAAAPEEEVISSSWTILCFKASITGSFSSNINSPPQKGHLNSISAAISNKNLPSCFSHI